jgi:thiol-disulfide isomerase/thioredoxin
MGVTTRRVLLSGAGAALVAGGTVAAATLLRKPAEPVFTPVAEPAPVLQGIVSLVRTDPAAALPAFGFADAAGATHGLGEFAGKGIVLNFWATWCVPCVAELPSLATLAGKLSGAGIIVLPLSTDRGGAPVVQKFYATHGVEGLGIWLDPKGLAAEALHLRGLPTTLVIDRQGRERGRLEGGADWASAEAVAEIARLVG